jgi:hypothetical protein
MAALAFIGIVLSVGALGTALVAYVDYRITIRSAVIAQRRGK